jgi:hypothetical protein
MNAKELEECLLLLVGDASFKTALPQEISSDDFAENVLGFEEVEEVEEDNQDGQWQAQEQSNMNFNNSIGQY